MFEDSTQRGGTRRHAGWPLAASAILHLGVLAALAFGAARGPSAGQGERPIDVVFLRQALEEGASAAAAAATPVSPAERRAERERQAVLEKLVQPSVVPDREAPDATARPPARAGGNPVGNQTPPDVAGAQPDLPVAAGGGVTRPEIVESSRVLPDYPEAAQRAGLEGQVVLRALIDQRGRARDVRVLRGLGLGLDEAAVAAVRRWKFRPATRNGSPVEVVYILSVYFRLEPPESVSPVPPGPPAGSGDGRGAGDRGRHDGPVRGPGGGVGLTLSRGSP